MQIWWTLLIKRLTITMHFFNMITLTTLYCFNNWYKISTWIVYNHKTILTLQHLATYDLLLHMPLPALSVPKLYLISDTVIFFLVLNCFKLFTYKKPLSSKLTLDCLIHVYLLWRVFVSAQYDYVMQILRNINSDNSKQDWKYDLI